MMVVGFLVGAAIAGVVGTALGVCIGIDLVLGQRRGEQLDIAPAIARDRRKRSVGW